MTTTSTPPNTATGLPLVVVAASLWGTSALFRQGLADGVAPTTLVFWEHVILAALMLPILVRIPWRKLTATDLLCLLLIGAGASALATVLFTTSLRYGAVNTTLLLQQLQPLIAVAAARLLLGERLTPRYLVFFGLAVAAAWLLTFPDPLDVRFEQGAPALLSAAAATLWALGTVLGRRMTTRLSFTELTAARFGIGLPAAFLYATVLFGAGDPLTIGPADIGPLLGVVFVPGLLALLLYYNGLRRTPAALATLGELAFPASALLINYLAFGAVISFTETLGVVLMCTVLVAMSLAARRRPERVGVELPTAQASSTT